MHITIMEESHNRVTWQANRPVASVLIGILLAVLFLVAVVVFSPSPVRWQVSGAIVAIGLVAAVTLVLTMPMVDGGSLERDPDGGNLRRVKTWLFRGPREVLSLALERVVTFESETRTFEDGPTEKYALARLRVVTQAGGREILTDWAETHSVTLLGDVLMKVGRRELASGEGIGSPVA